MEKDVADDRCMQMSRATERVPCVPIVVMYLLAGCEGTLPFHGAGNESFCFFFWEICRSLFDRALTRHLSQL